jgi:hypothetical protein
VICDPGSSGPELLISCDQSAFVADSGPGWVGIIRATAKSNITWILAALRKPDSLFCKETAILGLPPIHVASSNSPRNKSAAAFDAMFDPIDLPVASVGGLFTGLTLQ